VLEQARLRAQARQRRLLLVLAGAAVGAAVGIHLKLRADRAAVSEAAAEGSVGGSAEEPVAATIDLTGENADAVIVVDAESDGPVV
jgi:hypothetical protein